MGFCFPGRYNQAVVNACSGGLLPALDTWLSACLATGRHTNLVCVQGVMAALGRGAYLPFVRDHIVQAQYFKDPLDMPRTLSVSRDSPSTVGTCMYPQGG